VTSLRMRTTYATAVTSLLACVAALVFGVSENVLIYPEISTLTFFTMGLICEKALSMERNARATVPGPVATGARLRGRAYRPVGRQTVLNDV
jgi:hypothetical protein